MPAKDLYAERAVLNRFRHREVNFRSLRIVSRDVVSWNQRGQHRDVDPNTRIRHIAEDFRRGTCHFETGRHTAFRGHPHAKGVRSEVKMCIDDAWLHREAGGVEFFRTFAADRFGNFSDPAVLDSDIRLPGESGFGIHHKTVSDNEVKHFSYLRPESGQRPAHQPSCPAPDASQQRPGSRQPYRPR